MVIPLVDVRLMCSKRLKRETGIWGSGARPKVFVDTASAFFGVVLAFADNLGTCRLCRVSSGLNQSLLASSKSGGLGLGLCMVHSVAENHGADIRFGGASLGGAQVEVFPLQSDHY